MRKILFFFIFLTIVLLTSYQTAALAICDARGCTSADCCTMQGCTNYVAGECTGCPEDCYCDMDSQCNFSSCVSSMCEGRNPCRNETDGTLCFENGESGHCENETCILDGPPGLPGATGETDCDDDLDNDFDTLIDCDDPDCALFPACIGLGDPIPELPTSNQCVQVCAGESNERMYRYTPGANFSTPIGEATAKLLAEARLTYSQNLRASNQNSCPDMNDPLSTYGPDTFLDLTVTVSYSSIQLEELKIGGKRKGFGVCGSVEVRHGTVTDSSKGGTVSLSGKTYQEAQDAANIELQNLAQQAVTDFTQNLDSTLGSTIALEGAIEGGEEPQGLCHTLGALLQYSASTAAQSPSQTWCQF